MRKTYMANILSEDQLRLSTQCFRSDQSTKISYRIQSWPGEPFTRGPFLMRVFIYLITCNLSTVFLANLLVRPGVTVLVEKASLHVTQ